jgi:integrase
VAHTFTNRWVETVKAGPVRIEHPDQLLVGLHLVVQPSGHKSWAVRYRGADGKNRKLTLGSYPLIPLAHARELGREALIKAKRGIDPGVEKQAAKAKAADTVDAICEEFLKRNKGRLRTAEERQRILKRLVYPKLGATPVMAVKRTDIARLLDHIEDTSGPRMAHTTLGVIRAAFNWHAARSDEFRSPIVRGMGRINVKDRARARMLNDAELAAVWKTAEAGQGPFPALVRFLLLTGARRQEAVAMPWNEVDGAGDWLLPTARNKAKFDLVRPLSKEARAILAEQPRISDFVFTAGRRPLGGISKAKASFDTACGVSDWCLHDLRRTARSLMSRAGVNADIAERCLGHVIPGIRGIYDRHEYRDEKAHAFEALAAQIARIVDPHLNVTTLRWR